MASTNSSGQDNVILAASKLSGMGILSLQEVIQSLPGVQVVCQDSDMIWPCESASNYVYYNERSVERNGYENSICRIDDRLVVMTHPGRFYYQTAHDNCILPALMLIGICLTIYLLLNRRRLWIDRITIYQFGVNILQGVLFLWTVGLNRFLNYPLGQLGCSVTSYLSATTYVLTHFVSPFASLNSYAESRLQDIDIFERLGDLHNLHFLATAMILGLFGAPDAEMTNYLRATRCSSSAIPLLFMSNRIGGIIIFLINPIQYAYLIRRCYINEHNVKFPSLAARLCVKFVAELITWLPIVVIKIADISGQLNLNTGGYQLMTEVLYDLSRLSCLISPLLAMFFSKQDQIGRSFPRGPEESSNDSVPSGPEPLIKRCSFKKVGPIRRPVQLMEGESTSNSSVSIVVEDMIAFQQAMVRTIFARGQARMAQHEMIQLRKLASILGEGTSQLPTGLRFGPRISRLSFEEPKTNRSRSKSI